MKTRAVDESLKLRARGGKDRAEKNRFYTFGILTTPAKDIFRSDYHAGLLSGITPRVKAARGKLKIIMMPFHPYRSLDQILRRHTLDGLLILTWRWIHPSIVRLIEKGGHPRVLVVNDPVPGLGVNHVYTDVESGMAQAVAHLVKKGRTKIGMLHGPMRVPFMTGKKRVSVPFIDTQLKKEGFLKALRAKRISGNKKWVRAGEANTEVEGYRVMKQWLREKDLPEAVICGNDDLAFGALRAADEAGKRVPQDLAVIGFDNNRCARSSTPPLTTVAQPLIRMGRDAVAILIRQIEESVSPIVSRKYPPKLIVRKTT